MTQSFDADKSQTWQVGHLVGAVPGNINAPGLKVVSASHNLTKPNLTVGTTDLDLWIDAISLDGWELAGASTLGTYLHLFFKRRLRPQ